MNRLSGIVKYESLLKELVGKWESNDDTSIFAGRLRMDIRGSAAFENRQRSAVFDVSPPHKAVLPGLGFVLVPPVFCKMI